ncbi:MAG TPA: ABC transporter ATP-binding protein [Candidatus Acidoferrales bacterium]|nr:ABC transporter ATP-binding protein [Candidatus Acidoferrales bacterium]
MKTSLSTGPGTTTGNADPKTPAKPLAWKVLPHVWPLLKPRRGIFALGFVLMATNRFSGLVLPASSKYLLDDIILKRHVHLLVPLVLVVFFATIVQALTSYALTQLISKSSQKMIADLRIQVQAHIGRLPVSFYDSNRIGSLVSRIMTDVEGVRNLIGTGLIDFVGGIMTAAIALGYLLRASAMMTATAALFLVIFAFGLTHAFKAIRPYYRARPRINAEVTGRLTESLGGVRIVKGYHAEEREAAVFRVGVQRLLDNVVQTLTATSLMSAGATVLMGIISASIMFLGARSILSGAMTPGEFISYLAFLAMLIVPVAQVVSIGPLMTEALAGLERTREVLDEKPEDQDPRRTVRLDRIEGTVVFKGVSFAYDINKQVLSDISFESKPGTLTAFVGPSGAGKSTIIGLIAAFYVPTSGSVLVDGFDLAAVRLDSYRTQLGVVLQETFLFDGTIRDNVVFARPCASEEEILAACRIAHVDEFAKGFAGGYDTVVGEHGVKLSGGQRQRVSIARAILANPRILILDEATSSLDSESEALIQQGLSHLMSGRTTFVIAHRLSTIRRADQILVVEAGRIIERGTHESLLAARGRYHDHFAKQQGLEANLFLAPGEEEAETPETVATDAEADGALGRERGSVLPDAIRMIREPRV